MKRVFSVIWKIIAVALILAGIYLIVQVMGEPEAIIEKYEQMTGNERGALSSIKIQFLAEYIKRTGDSDILVRMGISSEDQKLVLDNVDGDGVTPEDDRQGNGDGDKEPYEPEPGPGPEPGPNPSPGPGENPKINYALLDSEGFLYQSQANFSEIKGNDAGRTLKSAGCALIAWWNAYAASGGTVRLEDMILEFGNTVKNGAVRINSQGYLACDNGAIGGLGRGDQLWNYLNSKYYNLSGRKDNSNPDVKVNSIDHGTYVLYYSHKNGSTSSANAHWVYCTKNKDGSFVVHNKGSEGVKIGDKPLISYYKIS